MRRSTSTSTLSTKLFVAALPIVLAVAALLALTVRNDLQKVQQAENGADLGRVWEPLINAVGALENELAAARVTAGTTADEPTAASASSDDFTVARAASDAALSELDAAIARLDGAPSAQAYMSAARDALTSGRQMVDLTVQGSDAPAGDGDPLVAYERASRGLVAVGEVLPSEAGDPELGTSLLGLLKLARARLAAGEFSIDIETWQTDPSDGTHLATARGSFAEMENHLDEFEAIAPTEWVEAYRSSGFPNAIDGFRNDLNQAAIDVRLGRSTTFDTASFNELIRQGVGFQTQTAQSIVEQAEAQVSEVRSSSFRRILITLGAVLLASLLAWFISRSITRRVKAVAAGANRVSSEQLPALVEALQDPRGKAVLPEIEDIPVKGSDELAELADAFNSMQATLVDVAQEQVEVLRRGVSDIFVTMARRNRSLIDRQLAMLDEYEANVEDPEILANYYQLDHLATRMRRNSESLLVLANAEPKRKRVKATEIDDVVRASIGEVEDYRRIEIEALESLQVRGNVVADISHLLAELLDNAASFSPPDTVVRVGGRRADDSYMLRIVDDGVGIGTERMRELNELLREPPIVGLSVESTLGMSVVSLLANKHGIKVTLAAGNPGLTVDVLLPSSVFGPIDTPAAAAPVVPPAPTTQQQPEPIAQPAPMLQEPVAQPAPVVPPSDWGTPVGHDGYAPSPAAEFDQPGAPAVPVHDDDAPRVATADWTKMSLNLSAFKSGMASAEAAAAPDATSQDESEPEPAARRAEFDRPLAPPVSAAPLTQRPVAPEDALGAPVPAPAPAPAPGLPTRSPGSGRPDGGPDRLADDGYSAPSALEAALGDLRSMNGSSTATPVEDDVSAAASRLDPDALRERLRAFQSEFRSGSDLDQQSATNMNSDLGGDR